MFQFILRRASLVIPTFLGVTLLTFALIHLVPGDPVEILAGERGIEPARHAALRADLGLDRPMLVQYGIYIMENLDFRGLIDAGVYEFAFVFGAQPIKGATGSAGRPFAIR